MCVNIWQVSLDHTMDMNIKLYAHITHYKANKEHKPVGLVKAAICMVTITLRNPAR